MASYREESAPWRKDACNPAQKLVTYFRFRQGFTAKKVKKVRCLSVIITDIACLFGLFAIHKYNKAVAFISVKHF